MNPTNEYLLKHSLIGLLRGLADALEHLQVRLLQPAASHHGQEADLRAVRHLRQRAKSLDLDPDAAEFRYWRQRNSGRTSADAVEAVHSELDRS